jgi:hypothetical protein
VFDSIDLVGRVAAERLMRSLGGRTPAQVRQSLEPSIGSATTTLANPEPIRYETQGLSF